MNTGDLMDGRFRLREQLGAGGMAVVWRAHDEVLGRDVALKVLSADLAQDPALLARIRDEARAVARLRHPNVVDVYDYGEVPGPQGRPLPYVVMEVVEGRSLSRLLTAGALPWRLAVLIGAQVAAALAAAHERGVVHRDVKPGNVVVGGARVKLVDFGISAVSGDDDRSAGLLLGTPAYLAPERLEKGVVRPETDVYALGLMLYRALAGHLPWQASTTTEMLIAHRYQEPDPLPPIVGLPDDVAALCRRCLDKSPDRRPGAAEVATVLAAAAGLSLDTLALPGAPTGTALPDDEVPTRTVVLAGAAASRALATRLAAAARRWRELPHRRRIGVAAGAAALLLIPAAAVTLSDSPPGKQVNAGVPAAAPRPAERAPECAVGYVVSGTTDGRFTTKVSIANTGTVGISAAILTFALPGGQQLRSGAPGTWRQNGREVSAQVGDLAAGGSRTATFRGTYQAVNALPDRFELNGTTCQAALSVAGVTTKPPTTRTVVRSSESRESSGKDAAKEEGKKKEKAEKKEKDEDE
ncbi:serine/threonine-protein kinase [Actinoplanes aureus]|nr:serine/threonine-protein kinase [Actinoplanes aureus]